MTHDLFNVIAILFAIGGVIIFCAQFFGTPQETIKELWLLYRVQVLIVAPVLVATFFGGWVLYICLIMLTARGAWELIEICRPFNQLSNAVLFIIPTIFLLSAVISILIMGQHEDNRQILLLVYIIIETNDAFALLFGKLWGRHHPFPVLSPKKTIEGLIGGAVAAIALTIGLSVYADLLALDHLITLTAATLISGLAGDLTVSWYKRKRNRKDFSSIHILHGGVIDIYDSYLFTCPVIYLISYHLA